MHDMMLRDEEKTKRRCKLGGRAEAEYRGVCVGEEAGTKTGGGLGESSSRRSSIGSSDDHMGSSISVYIHIVMTASSLDSLLYTAHPL